MSTAKKEREFANKIDKMREKLGITKMTMGRELGVSRQAVMAWGDKGRIPHERKMQIIDKLRKKAKEFDKIADALILDCDGEGYK